MNIYTTQFFARCPVNNIRVAYTLRIESETVIMADTIIDTVEGVLEGFHEAIADQLVNELGGAQTLTAFHHGVTIETHRK
jgi:hypothetical protein